MKTINLYLSTTSSFNPPTDKTNMANVKWFINWKSIFDEFIRSNKIISKVKARLITSASVYLSFISSIGTLRANFSSPFSNISNGFTLGIPTLKRCEDTQQGIIPFLGTITQGQNYGILSILPVAPAEQRLQFTGSIANTVLTVTTANLTIPISSVLNYYGQPGGILIVAQLSATTYTISADMGTVSARLMTSVFVNNPVFLPLNSKITGPGVPAGTFVTSAVSLYSYTVSTNTAVATTTMMCDPSIYYLELDTMETEGQSVIIPNNNILNIQFLSKDEQTLMTSLPDYQLMLSFDVDE